MTNYNVYMYNVYMKRMQIYIPEALFAELKRMSEIQDIPMSEIIRNGLRKELDQGKAKDKNFDPMKDFVGFIKDCEPTDAVEEVKKYYEDF